MNILIVGSGRGIGKTLAERCIQRGHRVGVGLLHFDEEKRQTWESKSPGNVLALHTDGRNQETLRQAAKVISERFGEINVVIYNAGVLCDGDRVNSIVHTDLDELHIMLEVNAVGILSCFQSVYPYMSRHDGKGKFIAVTAGGGTFYKEDPIFPAYTISKTAANKIVHVLKNQVKDVEVLAVHPGRVNTDMGRTTYQIELDESIDGLQQIVENPVCSKGWFIDYKGESLPI